MLRKFLFLTVMCLGLAACEDPIETAESYYQSALRLVAEGDTSRALLELRNVFDYNGQHTDARRLFADLLIQEGNMRRGYSQYLRLVEQLPNDIDVRLYVADLALDFGDWEEVERHTELVQVLDANHPGARGYKIMLEYRNARVNRDDVTAGEAVQRAQDLLAEAPDLEVMQRLMIDWLATGPDPERALPYIEAVIERRPNALSMHMDKVRILSVAQRNDEVETQLREMYDRFPENEDVLNLVLRWYVSREEYAEVEEFLRERAGEDTENFEEHVAVIQLLERVQGRDAAVAEMQRLAEANEGTDLGRRYTLMTYALLFDPRAGEEDQNARANALLALIEEIDGIDLRNEARIELVRVRGAQGDLEEAKRIVGVILESDPSNVSGLLLRAAWLIQEQSFGEAITDLRVALDQSPRNSDVLLLLAEAHQKLGNAALAEERLARAVDVSGLAAREVLIFAQFQISRGNLGTASQVLTESLRVNGDLNVAQLLGQVLLQRGEFDDLTTLIAQLNRVGIEETTGLANSLQAAMLFNQNRIEESLAFLRSNLIEDGDPDSNFETDVQILRVQMLSGRLDEARVQLQKLRGQYPESLALRLLQGNILSLEGNDEAAIAVYRRILEENPDELIVIQRLYSALQAVGQEDAASELLVQALDSQPEARALQALRALEYERDGDYEAAIFIYEELYALNPNDVGVANNLASVLSYYRTGEEDLDRAHQISLRLEGTQQPEFLDTLGYVQLRRGEVNEAVLNLQAAARGLPNNATVAFNLALAYAEANRAEDARAELDRGFRLAGERTNIPQLGRARILERQLNEAAAEADAEPQAETSEDL